MTKTHQDSLHEQRRRAVAEATTRLIAQKGLDRVSVRDIAVEAGYSTHVVSHYFENKKELLLFTLREVSQRSVDRLKMAIEDGEDVARCLETFLPLDSARIIDARLWLTFWTAALHDPDIAAEQLRFGSKYRDLMLGLLRLRDMFPHGTPADAQDVIAQRLQMAISGIAVHGVLGVWDENQQRRMLAAELGQIVPADSTAHTDSATDTVQSPAALAEENARLRRLLVNTLLDTVPGRRDD